MANLEIGLVGMPGSGKTTLLNALSRAGAEAGGYSGSGKANVAIAPVPDPRLDKLAEAVGSRKLIPATIQLVDLPGLQTGAGAKTGELLGQVRQVDALMHVVRCFEAAGVEPEPRNDMETVEVELVAADAGLVERAVKRARSDAKSGDRAMRERVTELEAFFAWLDDGNPARTYAAGVPEGLDLLSSKPVLYVANTAEPGESPCADVVHEYANESGGSFVDTAAQIESEIAALDPAEAEQFLQDLGLTEPTVQRVARAAFEMLDLVTFFTIGEKEARAWLLRRNAAAVDAAGKIHTDIARGFIRAEVIEWQDLVEHGSHTEVARHGRQRLEGKTYEVQDGDVLNIRFNV